jgi:FdhD protein
MTEDSTIAGHRSATDRIRLLGVSGDRFDQRDDLVAVEEPLELRIGFGAIGARRSKTLSITMRTPGNDEELTVGFLYGEQVISSQEDILEVVAADSGENNAVRAELHPRIQIDEDRLQREFMSTSSCGVCGKACIESLSLAGTPVMPLYEPMIDPEIITALPDRLRTAQEVFEDTGGVHAAGLFSPEGEMLIVREDIGRHNAVDKVIGARMLKNGSCRDTILVVSGRIGFELVQKAVVAGIPALIAVGAPTSLAVSVADEFGMTLVGFVRGNRFNVYVGEQRVRSTINTV